MTEGLAPTRAPFGGAPFSQKSGMTGWSPSPDLLHYIGLAIYGGHGLDDAGRMDAHGPVRAGVIPVVAGEALDVAIEDEADDLGLLVDDGAARVPADDVDRGDEV